MEAELAFEEGEIPVGAVLVHEGRVLAKAYNQTEKLKDVTAHAEMLVITGGSHELQSKFLEECDLYVTLEPCPMCASAMYWARIKNLYIAAPDPNRGFSRFGEGLLHPKTSVFTGLLRNQSEELLKHFFDNLRTHKNN